MREIYSRRLKEVKAWVINVYERDNYTCQNCGSKERLHAHHIKTWDEAPELRVDLANGITLCSSCHQKHHTKGLTLSMETRAKIVESRKWYKHSEETKEKQRKNAGRPKGIPMKQEQKELYRDIFTGRKHSEATKEKIRANAGRPKGTKATKEQTERQKKYYSERVLIKDPITGKRKWVKK